MAPGSDSALPLAPELPGTSSVGSSPSILQPAQNAASAFTGLLPLLSADLPGVPVDGNVASPTSLIPLFPGAISGFPASAPAAAAAGASAKAVETADNLSAPLSAAVPPLASGAAWLLSPQALDNLCPDPAGLVSAPNLSTAPAAAGPVLASVAGAARDRE
jgi:hypothetical protein